MKIIRYGRSAKSSFHIHAGSYATCLYIPDQRVVLFSEQRGTFGGIDFSITDRAEMINEGEIIASGKTPKVDGVSYSEIKEFDYDGKKLQELVQNARLRNELVGKVKSGIEELLKASK